MKKVLVFTSIAEALTGLALLIVPSLVGRLLFGKELTGVAIPVAQMLGIALISLSVACWPKWSVICGMFTYSTLATFYLAYVGLEGTFIGQLLWPAVGLHAILSLALARIWYQLRKTTNNINSDSNDSNF
ncbi:hypothetical protein [Flavobacterium sp. N3904]|uniref:hypothetical protein n=1 Tax=Flavobacterium sp. N3904 TaxID=2986835 RepID=UPI0022248E4D|nr:hypothetical protein [Flavobacterium sp. N3904]